MFSKINFKSESTTKNGSNGSNDSKDEKPKNSKKGRVSTYSIKPPDSFLNRFNSRTILPKPEEKEIAQSYEEFINNGNYQENFEPVRFFGTRNLDNSILDIHEQNDQPIINIAKKPPVGSKEWHQNRKESHKAVERKRRECINYNINCLGQMVPGPERNKGGILNRVVKYINELKIENAVLKAAPQEPSIVLDQLKQQMKENEKLRKINSRLKLLLISNNIPIDNAGESSDEDKKV